MNVAADLDTLYRTSDDPWGFRTRWYERRKRALLLASLPRERFDTAWEIGCSIGELAADLAHRCSHLLASDGNERAVDLATDRLGDQPHARVARLWLPDQWPAERFDLVVMSEFAYFLSREDFHALLPSLVRSLTSDGVFAACHWRHPVDCSDLTGDEIHQTLARELPWTLAVTHEEPDFRLDVWTVDPRPIAKREGIA
jgi:trans-aconitate methyltransferase